MKKYVALVFILLIGSLYFFDKIYPNLAYSELGAVNNILVYKAERKLVLLNDDKVIKTYKISLGGAPVGNKQQEGDQKTPEGSYYIDWKHPSSSFHQALRISYPNSLDKIQAEKKGVSPGGDIMIHGLPNYLGWLYPLYKTIDWTDGCIAVSNVEIEEIISSVKVGTPITIYP